MYEDVEQYMNPSKCCLAFLKMTHHNEKNEGWEDVKSGVRTVFYTTVEGKGVLNIHLTKYKNGAIRREYPEIYLESRDVKTFQECLQSLFTNPEYAKSLELRIKYYTSTVCYKNLYEFLTLLSTKTWKKYKQLYESLDSNSEAVFRKLK